MGSRRPPRGVRGAVLGRGDPPPRCAPVRHGPPPPPSPATAGPPFSPGSRVFVFSRTLAPGTVNGVTIVRDDPVALARSLRQEEGTGEIWLFGGGELFATLLDAGQVDRIEVTVVPVLLGGGVPLVAHITKRSPLALIHSEVYPTGMVALHYKV